MDRWLIVSSRRILAIYREMTESERLSSLTRSQPSQGVEAGDFRLPIHRQPSAGGWMAA
jgi:hypothetical protein